MGSLQNRIRFLRDCYRADSRTGGVLDVFASKVEHLRFLSGPEEILTGRLNPLPVLRERFEAAARAAEVYRREKSLFYGAFLLVGPAVRRSESEIGGSRWPQTVRAPLFLWPADLTIDPEYPDTHMPLTVRLEEARINFAAFTAMLGDEERALEVTEQVLATWPELPLSPDVGTRLAQVLESHLDSVDATALREFPRLLDRRQVQAVARKTAKGRLFVLPAALVALTVESLETRGVLHDLSAMAASSQVSPPLECLLGAPPDFLETREPSPARNEPARSTVPAVLSAAQEQALVAACHHVATLVVGPPGTGKTFTLASVALDQLARGRTVLIAARSRQALDVAGDKVEALLGERSVLLEGGRRERLRALKSRLERLLHGGVGFDPAPSRSLGELHGHLAEVESDLAQIEERILERSRRESVWGRAEVRGRSGPMSWWQPLLHALRSWRLARSPDYWSLRQEYETLLETVVRRSALLLRTSIHRRRIAHLRQSRKDLQRFLSGLRARQSSRQARMFSELDWRAVLGAFPLWSVRFADIHRVVPRNPELFDLVIVDEATQCDMATALPTVLRGRRLLVTGDPKQLRHVSFLARDRQFSLARQHGLADREVERLDYRDRSLLDLVDGAVEQAGQAIFLDEHFRSTPQIIRFSNREFYQGSLRVMTRRPETMEQRSLFLRCLDGRRHPEGHNPREAECIVAELFERIEQHAELPADRAPSFGILSPFRAQVEHLGEQLHRDLPLSALERHRVRVGTPYAFQGEERDVMFLSLALDDASPQGSFRYLEREDVLNVSVTRARDMQILFCSFDPGKLSPKTLLGRYLAFVTEEPGSEPRRRDPHSDRFLQEVRKALEQRGFRAWPAYPTAGLEIDLMVEKHGQSLAIDLVGHPGAYGAAFTLERCRILRRAGLDLFALPFSAWRRTPSRCLEAIEARITTEKHQ